MRLLANIILFSGFIANILASQDSTITLHPRNVDSSNNDIIARSKAADYDMAFFVAFLTHFDSNIASYTSYMIKNHITLPQGIANYYNHLATLPDDGDLAADIVSTFPFTQFQTFITAFPWYSSLLQDGGITTMYLPEYFMTASDLSSNSSIATSMASSASIVPNTQLSTVNNTQSFISASSTINSSSYSVTKPTSSVSSMTNRTNTSKSKNGAKLANIYKTLPLWAVALFGLFL